MSKVVLLVEDNADDVVFMERAFKRVELPHPFRTAKDGQQAVDDLAGIGAYADRAAFPAATHVILDIKLPLRSGLEVLRWIRSEPELSGLPVVVLTSSTEHEDIEQAFELGVQGYLVKPVGFPELVALARKLREWVETGLAPQPARQPTT